MDGPRSRRRCAKVTHGAVSHPEKGSRPNVYPHRARRGEERLPGARCRQRRRSNGPSKAPPGRDAAILRRQDILSGRSRGMRECPSLGQQDREAWSRDPAYATAVRRPYVKRNKNDAADAEAICEAVTRPTMRFVPIKSIESASGADAAPEPRPLDPSANGAGERAAWPLRRARCRGWPGHLERREAGRGRHHSEPRTCAGNRSSRARGPHEPARCAATADPAPRCRALGLHRANAASQRLATIPGVGPITASAIVATITSAAQFRSAREFFSLNRVGASIQAAAKTG
jgi:transposase